MRHQLEAFERSLVRRLQRPTPPTENGPKLTVVWSAGKAGFDATREQAKGEFENFEAVLATSERIALRCPHAVIDFSMMSSAGGLFEGQRSVLPSSLARPRRPYGELKLQQEERLLASRAPLAKKIYRPSSVFGRLHPGHRRGLIGTLVRNATRHAVTYVAARTSTLRDFVWAEDIGTYVAQVILDEEAAGDDRVAFLASARPASIHEVQNEVQTVLRRRVYVCYDQRASNDLDTTLTPHVLPERWHSTVLRAAVARVYQDWISGT